MKSRPVNIDLEAPVQQVEKHLADLHEALRGGDPAALECSAASLHRALSGAVEHFRAAAHLGVIPPPLRQRLALASARVAAQREALARATASLDRAIDVLLPARAPTYGATGQGARQSYSGSVIA
jgi:ABC-type transporter Mla subunit MlaD